MNSLANKLQAMCEKHLREDYDTVNGILEALNDVTCTIMGQICRGISDNKEEFLSASASARLNIERNLEKKLNELASDIYDKH